jgi:MFS transporter, OFA family, oxalate/formate antiporter
LYNEKVSKSRYLVTISASILIMLCAGAVYAWSIFVAPLEAEYGYTTTQTQIIFGLIIGIFTIGMLFVNKILRKYGPRITSVIGAVLFCAGYITASFSGGNILILILGMSLLSGIGMSFGYVTVLNTLVKWFPDHKGLATGLAVSGFGGGAILLSQIARPLLSSGWQVMDIFRIVGIVYGVLFLAGSLALTVPAWYKPKLEEAHVDIKLLLRDRRFWILFYVFFAGTFAGLLFSGNLKPIGQSYGVGEGAAVIAISLFSIGNAAGRIFWGQIHDIIGGKAVIAGLSLVTGLTLLLLIGSSNDAVFMLLAFFLGLTFASNMVNYAADVCGIWGVAKLDIVYPAISIAYGISGVLGPISGGLIRDASGTYYIALIISAVICGSGLITYTFLKAKNESRAEAAARKSAVSPCLPG